MKNKILVFAFIIYIGVFSILSVIIPDKKISYTERRKLNEFPNFEFTSSWINDVDKYLLDHFIFRDDFRSIKAYYNFEILNRFDNNGIYLKDNYIFKSIYPTNKESVLNFKEKMNKISTLFSENNNVYFILIPDKNYYLNSEDFLHIDYNYIFYEINKLPFKNIYIKDLLELSDYYQTDTHWKQEKLNKVIKKMSDEMNFKYEVIQYEECVYDQFRGVYYGESAIKRESEKLIYLQNETFNKVLVKYLENDKFYGIYNKMKLVGIDSYDVYLDGASSFIEIFNSNATSNKELVIFRDSFGSSLAPLLVNYYKKITLIDNRYISSDIFSNMIKFTDQDILIMYSTLLINDSSSLKG